MIKKILIGLLVLIIIIVAGFVIRVNTYEFVNYDDQYPIEDLAVEGDSAMLARGEYLVYGPAHCGHCHVPPEKLFDVENGAKVAMTGGFGLEIPPGKFNGPNITSHEDGIGRLSDGEIYRMLRYNIRPNGHSAIDFMPFTNMTDYDIHSVIAYLRSTEPVAGKYPETEYTFLGKVVRMMGAIKPGVPDENIPKKLDPAPTIEYGKYMAYAVANCRGCHTNRDMNTGEYIGPDYAGGLVFGPDNLTAGWTYMTPNLTNDPETGIMYGWDEDYFIERMRKGRVHETSPMPWGAVQNMNEVELRAVYKYLMSIDPVKNEVAQTATPPKEA